MEPNYSKYSLTELEESLSTIDQQAYPERTAQLKEELQSRRVAISAEQDNIDDTFDSNEQFYKCPNCEKKISVFSKTLNKWGKFKVCPHCDETFEVLIRFKTMAILTLPLLIIHLFILSPILASFGWSSAFSTGIFVWVMAVLSMRLKKVRDDYGR